MPYFIISFLIVLDVNDNEPQFLNSPYSFSIDETVSVGDILYNSVGVRDLDTGLNGIVNITCDADLSPEACDVFEIKTRNADLVRFSTTCILLRSKLDYYYIELYYLLIFHKFSYFLGLHKISEFKGFKLYWSGGSEETIRLRRKIIL